MLPAEKANELLKKQQEIRQKCREDAVFKEEIYREKFVRVSSDVFDTLPDKITAAIEKCRDYVTTDSPLALIHRSRLKELGYNLRLGCLRRDIKNSNYYANHALKQPREEWVFQDDKNEDVYSEEKECICLSVNEFKRPYKRTRIEFSVE